jgi:GTPase Era involved in 16S rRNA processing
MTNKLNELKEKRRLKTEQLEWLFSKLVAINIWVLAQNCWQKKSNNLNERTKIINI